MFQLTSKEKAEVVANCDHLAKLKYSPAKPFAFTEHGAVMVASVLNSKRAIEVSVYVVRAFVKVREVLGAHSELAQKLTELERRMERPGALLARGTRTIGMCSFDARSKGHPRPLL